MQTLKDDGSCDEAFVYLTTDDGVEVEGWYEEDMETFATKKFNRGEGYMINNTTGGDAGVQVAGQVNLAKTVLPLREFYSLVGNIRPLAISIQDIKPVADEIGGGVFDIQTLKDDGSCDEAFVYLTTDDGVEVEGWYEEDMETFATKSFDPSEGIMINNTTGGDAAVEIKAITL